MIKFSVSSIDTYNKCPKKYHYRYIEKPDIVQNKWSFTEFGSCAHRILELFHETLIKENVLEKDYSSLMKACFVKGVREYDSNILEEKVWTPDGDVRGLEYLKDVIQDYLFYLKENGVPDVVGVEVPYSFNLTLDSGQEIMVRGIIDRIDRVGPGEYKVVDYKTSKNEKYLKSFQLLVYAEAIKRKYSDAKVVHGSFMLLKHKCKTKDWTFTDSEIEECVKFIKNSASLVEAEEKWIKKPSILCRWCDYVSICQDSWTEE